MNQGSPFLYGDLLFSPHSPSLCHCPGSLVFVKVRIETFLTTCSQADEEMDINVQIEEKTWEGKLEMKDFTLGQSGRR